MVIRRCDNLVVAVASNCTLIESTKLVPRWSKKQKKKKEIDVSMHEMVHTYKRNMGGVDLFDQFVANYRIRIRSKKWWWPFFSWSIDAYIVDAWIMYKSIKGFSISLLLKQSCTPRSRPGLKIGYAASQLPMLSGSTEKTIGRFLFQLTTPDVVFVEEDPQISVRSARLHCTSSALKCITKLKITKKYCIFKLW